MGRTRDIAGIIRHVSSIGDPDAARSLDECGEIWFGVLMQAAQEIEDILQPPATPDSRVTGVRIARRLDVRLSEIEAEIARADPRFVSQSVRDVVYLGREILTLLALHDQEADDE